jgi:protein-tyrosine phosphatase
VTGAVLAPTTGSRWRGAVSRLMTAALTHPIALRIKAPVKSMLWRFRGLGTQNPPLPAPVNSVLFVCLGNICRSPFGAELAGRLIREAGTNGVRCTSAGIRPSQAERSPEPACQASEAFGLSLREHRPQALTRELIDSHDIVWVMEQAQLTHLRAEYPAYRDRIFLLSLFDTQPRNAYERYNIADPFGDTLSGYEACYQRIERALRCWIPQSFS